MDQRKAIAKLLREFADYVEAGTLSDLEEALTAATKRSTEVRDGSKKGLSDDHKPRSAPPVQRDWASVSAMLASLSSREEGRTTLAGLELVKRELEEFARHLDLPVNRHDSVERLRDKIIEMTIGSRLSSKAVRGD